MLHNKIYALCDYQTLQKKQVSLLEFLEICKGLDIIYIQYRDKISPTGIQKQNLQILKKNTDIPIIINDKLELLSFADGLHLGQEDLDLLSQEFKIEDKKLLISFLRKKYSNKIFGLSTHNEKEILEANSFNLDYIGLGAYRDTNTKDVSVVVGDKISYLAKISKHPVGAIGGVKVSDNIENISYNVVGSDLFV